MVGRVERGERVLERNLHCPPVGVGRRRAGRRAVKQYRSRVTPFKQGEQPGDGGLARAALPDKARDGAAAQLQVDAGQGGSAWPAARLPAARVSLGEAGGRQCDGAGGCGIGHGRHFSGESAGLLGSAASDPAGWKHATERSRALPGSRTGAVLGAADTALAEAGAIRSDVAFAALRLAGVDWPGSTGRGRLAGGQAVLGHGARAGMAGPAAFHTQRRVRRHPLRRAVRRGRGALLDFYGLADLAELNQMFTRRGYKAGTSDMARATPSPRAVWSSGRR